MRRRIVRLAVIALPLIVLAACSGDDGDGDTAGGGSTEATAPEAYVEGLCTAVADYQADLTERSSAFQEAFTGGAPSAEDTKDVIIGFLDEISARTRQLIDEVQALGTPDVPDGEQAREAVTGAFEQVITLFDEAKADIEDLPVDDPAAMAQGFGEIGAKLQEAGAEIQSSLSGFESPELDEAAEGIEACGALT